MDDLLVQWDRSLDPELHDRLQTSLERRQFLHDSFKATAGFSLLPSMLLFTACDQPPQDVQAKIVRKEPWSTFAAVQQVLFPDDGNGPGAEELNATAYLKFVLDAADTDSKDRDFILKGIGWLNQLSVKQTGRHFSRNVSAEKDKLIEQISRSRSGERWLSFLLLYVFEALLTDPVYGSNPNGIGWAWLEHQPGFPSPPGDKTYPELLKK